MSDEYKTLVKTIFITDEGVARFEEIFNTFDLDGTFEICVNQVVDCLGALGFNTTKADLVKYTFGLEAKDRISREMFLNIYEDIIKREYVFMANHLVNIFRQFDPNSTGFVPVANLRDVLTSIGENLSDEQFHEAIDGMVNADGYINYEEFVAKSGRAN